MNPIIVTPATPLIDLPRAKLQCKITSSERDTEITEAVDSAQAWAQAWLGFALGEQRLSWSYDPWPGCVTLPYDVTAVVSVTAGGDPVDYERNGRTFTVAADAAVPVVITIDCGLPGESVPQPIKSAMLLVVVDLIVNQQAQVSTQLYRNEAVENLLSLFRERLPL